MKKKLVAIAVTSVLTASSGPLLAEQNPDDLTTNEPNYTAMGIGAASGVLMAGAAGLIVGGFIANIIGSEHSASEVQSTPDNDALLAEYTDPATEASAANAVAKPTQAKPEDLLLASANEATPLPGSHLPVVSERIKQIIADDLNISVYFKVGSVAFESFYTQQLSVMSHLLQEMPDVELHLDGYSDRHGNQSDNLRLSAERIESVRDYFVNNGIDPSRIHIRAYGEKNFLSTPGELDSYMFDRRVVVSFRLPSSATDNTVAVTRKTSQP